ncbi:hypothetical protein HAX54_033177 [Datura stramonium]|uniref:Uncharacterized protein n=1 Tax=Datura stramonium TaxID=4076 RepID=A0ABS8VCJ6_DATST|nr:hypothetical protein [Datura stramonium]
MLRLPPSNYRRLYRVRRNAWVRDPNQLANINIHPSAETPTPPSPPVFSTTPLPLNHVPLFWLEHGLSRHMLSMSLQINGQDLLIQIIGPCYLAKIVAEDTCICTTRRTTLCANPTNGSKLPYTISSEPIIDDRGGRRGRVQNRKRGTIRNVKRLQNTGVQEKKRKKVMVSTMFTNYWMNHEGTSSHLSSMREERPQTRNSNMTIIVWNCHGVGNADFRRTFRSMLDYNKPSLVALLETKQEDHDNITRGFGFSSLI